MKKLKLTNEEKEIENALLYGEFKPLKGKELEKIEKALKARKKDITMTIRVNSEDIDKIKDKANKLGIKWVLIFGQKEALEDFITLRDMDTGVQKEIKLDKVVEEMKNKIKK